MDAGKIRELFQANDNPNIAFTGDPEEIRNADFVIIAVTKSKDPDISYIESAAGTTGTKWNFHRYSPGLIGGLLSSRLTRTIWCTGITVFECGASAKSSNFCEKFASKKSPPDGVTVFGRGDGWCDCGCGA